MNQIDADVAFNELTRLPDRATAATCFGAPVSAGDRTVIPVAEVNYGLGFGFGGGTGPGEQAGRGGGGGGGARTRGIAVIDVAPDGVRVHPIEDATSIALAGIALASSTVAIASRTLLKLVRG